MGVARAEALGVEAERLQGWLSAGRHGSMDYMEETAAVRSNPKHAGMLPSARSVIVLATAFARGEPVTGPAPGRIARYAQGRDYHNLLEKRGRKLAAMLRAEGHTARLGVDRMPLFERAWAQRAGVGFIGKNCCLIVPGLGSHVFLSVVVTSAELPVDEPLKERCGECTRCLDACPTQAFVDARQLDARRCISYLTIEHRAPIDVSLRASVGSWLFGCDVCQDVCPFNATSPLPASDTAAFAPDLARAAQPATRFLEMSESEFVEFSQGSALKRPGREGMARNAAIVLGNRGDRRALPVLQAAARQYDSETVREAARWACAQLEAREPEGEPPGARSSSASAED
jgi:epoxyqueuosine reductase